MIGMGAMLTQADGRRLHRFRLRTPLLKLGVELDHEFLGAVVVDIPQAQNERLRSSLQQTSDQTHQLITGRDYIQSGSASAEYY